MWLSGKILKFPDLTLTGKNFHFPGFPVTVKLWTIHYPTAPQHFCQIWSSAKSASYVPNVSVEVFLRSPQTKITSVILLNPLFQWTVIQNEPTRISHTMSLYFHWTKDEHVPHRCTFFFYFLLIIQQIPCLLTFSLYSLHNNGFVVCILLL